MSNQIRRVFALAFGLVVAGCGGGAFLPNAVLPPEAPIGLEAELTSNNQVRLTWQPPTPSPSHAPVTGYRVYRQSAGGETSFIGDTPTSSYLHMGIPPGTVHGFFVRAVSERGLSPPSETVFVDLVAPEAPVGPIAAPHVTVRAERGYEADGRGTEREYAVVSWIHRHAAEDTEDPTATDVQSVVKGFAVEYCEVQPNHPFDYCPGDWQRHSKSPREEALTRDLVDVFVCDRTGSNGERLARMYRVRALAHEPFASSRYSAPTPPVCPSANESPPRRVDAVFAADPVEFNRVNICWASEPRADGYELQVTHDDVLPPTEDGWLIVDAHIRPVASPACILYAGLADGDARWFRVRAYNLAGHGHWSAPYHYVHDDSHLPPLPTRSGALTTSALSISDARAREGEDTTLNFEVTLDRAAPAPVTVGYATADGTATAGEDYRAASGTLEFSAGETVKMIVVAVLDDTTDEGEETLTVHLNEAIGAAVADGVATGTIENENPVPKAWLARFGRSIAGQVVSAVGARLEGSAVSHATVGGVPFGFSGSPGIPRASSHRESGPAREVRAERTGAAGRLAERDVLRGSSFHLSSERHGPAYAAWGRVALEGFESDANDLRMDGDVTTGVLGADVEGYRWLAGAALSHSRARGTSELGIETAPERGRSEIESTMTGVYPYARVNLGDRVSLWGLAGAGQGELRLTEDGRAPIETPIELTVGAVGLYGTVLSPSEAQGFELAVRSDAFWTRMSSDAVRLGTGGRLAASDADASRLRLVVAATRTFALAAGGTLTPSLDVGVRHDGGDAETGAGLEVGGSMRYAGKGITAEGAVRALVAHEEDGYEELGVSGSVRIDPGVSGRGLSLALVPSIGPARSTVDRLWSLSDVRTFAGEESVEVGRRLEAEVGYGVGLAESGGVLTPYTGVLLADGGTRAWRLGARLRIAPELNVSLDGTRRDGIGGTPDHAFTLRGALRW